MKSNINKNRHGVPVIEYSNFPRIYSIYGKIEISEIYPNNQGFRYKIDGADEERIDGVRCEFPPLSDNNEDWAMECFYALADEIGV